MKQSRATIRYLKACSIIIWVAILLNVLSDYKEVMLDLENVCFSASLGFNLTVMAVVCQHCPKLAKYFMLQMFVFRSISIYVMFYFIELKGDQKYADKKQMLDAFASVIFPCFMLIRMEPKIDLLLAPLMLLVNFLTMRASLEDDGQMDCFNPASQFMKLMQFRQNVVLIIAIYGSHTSRKVELTLFYEQR